MALPTLPQYWTSRKNVYEQAIVRTRNHENDFREKWGKEANYWKKSNVEANKQHVWGSEEFLQTSLEKNNAKKEKEAKAEKLKWRRLKLADMLRKERNEWEAELKGFSRDNYSRLEDMKDRAEHLKSAREEKRKQTAQEKLYDFWRKNNPDIRKLEQHQFKEHVVDSWAGQVSEVKEREEKERMEKEAMEEQMEEERLKAVAADRQKQQEKIEEEKKMKAILKEQIDELKFREAESQRLKAQQEELQQEQWRIERIDEERKRVETARQKREHGRVLLRQHKAQMMRRSKQIQEELELDKKILESLIEQEGELEHLQTARRQKAQADAAWMKQVIEDQIRLEKAREAELDMLYQDEAARMWEKRDAEWGREKQARERLMQEVLDERQRQIEERIEQNRLEQEESLKQREQLLKEVELANQLTRREIKEAEDEKKAFKQQLKEQITSRKEREESSKMQVEAELKRQQMEDEEYADFLQKETERLRLKGFTPRNFGKKQAWT